MNIAILNLSGNVGKSTIAVHVFGAMMPGAKIISVESVNSTDADNVDMDVQTIEASNFKDIYKKLMMATGDVILDVGASNVTKFMSEISRFRSIVHEIDLIVVPVVPQDKQQRDTKSTLDWLQSHSFDPKRTRVFFNAFDNDGVDFDSAFAHILTNLDGSGVTFKPYAVLEQNEIFDRVKDTGHTVRELSEDKTDWRAKRNEAKANGDITGTEEAITGQMNNDLAQTAQQNIAGVFNLIMGKRK